MDVAALLEQARAAIAATANSADLDRIETEYL